MISFFVNPNNLLKFDMVIKDFFWILGIFFKTTTYLYWIFVIGIGPRCYYRLGIALTYITKIVLALVPYNYALVSDRASKNSYVNDWFDNFQASKWFFVPEVLHFTNYYSAPKIVHTIWILTKFTMTIENQTTSEIQCL